MVKRIATQCPPSIPRGRPWNTAVLSSLLSLVFAQYHHHHHRATPMASSDVLRRARQNFSSEPNTSISTCSFSLPRRLRLIAYLHCILKTQPGCTFFFLFPWPFDLDARPSHLEDLVMPTCSRDGSNMNLDIAQFASWLNSGRECRR